MPRDYMNLYGPKVDDRLLKTDYEDHSVQTGPVPVQKAVADETPAPAPEEVPSEAPAEAQ